MYSSTLNIAAAQPITRIMTNLKRRDAGAGRTGLTRNQVYPLGTVGSNPTLSATWPYHCIKDIFCHVKKVTGVLLFNQIAEQISLNHFLPLY